MAVTIVATIDCIGNHEDKKMFKATVTLNIITLYFFFNIDLKLFLMTNISENRKIITKELIASIKIILRKVE